MTTVLVAYASKHGSTAEIAAAVAQTLNDCGLRAACVNAGRGLEPRAVRRGRAWQRRLHEAVAPRGAPVPAPPRGRVGGTPVLGLQLRADRRPGQRQTRLVGAARHDRDRRTPRRPRSPRLRRQPVRPRRTAWPARWPAARRRSTATVATGTRSASGRTASPSRSEFPREPDLLQTRAPAARSAMRGQVLAQHGAGVLGPLVPGRRRLGRRLGRRALGSRLRGGLLLRVPAPRCASSSGSGARLVAGFFAAGLVVVLVVLVRLDMRWSPRGGLAERRSGTPLGDAWEHDAIAASWFASDSTPHFAPVIRPHLGACRALPGASEDERSAVQWQRYRPSTSARQAVPLAEREVRDLAELGPRRVHDRGRGRAVRGGSMARQLEAAGTTLEGFRVQRMAPEGSRLSFSATSRSGLRRSARARPTACSVT